MRRLILIISVAAIALATGVTPAVAGPAGNRITAYFRTAVGVYPGSDVRVLGVKVGEIESVRPEGTRVTMVMTIDDEAPIPAGVKAVVVAPALVADRYIQLSPPYTGGPKIADGTVLPLSRTASPMELDELYESVKRLVAALGPKGANKQGALSGVIQTGASNLDGNGAALNDMIAQFGKAARTLSESSPDLFATIENLQKFTAMLKANDGQVRRAERQLAQVSAFLAADRAELGAALEQLAVALGQVKGFIAGNRALLAANVEKLAAITQVLVDQRVALAEALDNVPLAASNVVNTYDPASGTLMGRGNLLEFEVGMTSPARAPAGDPVCAGASAKKTEQLKELCKKKQKAVAPQSLPVLPLPPVGEVYGSASADQGGN